MKLAIFLTFALFLLSSFSASAQTEQIAVGEWRDHLPYSQGIGVAYTGDVIYCATPHALFSYTSSEHTLERLTKINAISDIGINAIRYSPNTSTLVVGYTNGNLDLIKGSTTINLSFIRDDDLVGDKTIYHIYCVGDLAYLSCGFGIVVVDLIREEIKDTYLIGVNAAYVKTLGITTLNNTIYAATEEGLYSADLNNQFLNDFNSWTKRTDVPNSNGPFNLIAAYDNKLFINYDDDAFNSDTLYYYDGSNWTLFLDEIDNISLEPDANYLTIAHNYSCEFYDQNLTVQGFVFSYVPWNSSPKPNQVVLASSQDFWIADNDWGLVRAKNSYGPFNVKPDGPWNTGTWQIEIEDNQVMVASGATTGIGSAWGPKNLPDGASILADDSWRNYNRFTETAIGDTAVDFLSVIINPDDPGQSFMGSFSKAGLYELRDGEVVAQYTPANSTLSPDLNNDPLWSGVASMAYDDDGNLWIPCSKSESNQLAVLMEDGTWGAFDLCGSLGGSPIFPDIEVDEFGQIWMVVPNKGITVYNTNETLNNTGDDDCATLTTAQGGGNLPTSNVNTIEEDLDGELWIGTSEGVAVIYSPGNVFSGGNYDAQQILIEQDGNIQILLETEEISDIKVDGANRKWIATTGSGVFLMSADGTEEIFHFTTENSPLFSNNIQSIGINHENGEVFFGTNRGLLSFRSTATGGSLNYSGIVAYPNPVREDYSGPIAIKGLVRDSDVKVTDISGNLVFVTTAFGGQAIWDGNDLQGNRVKTGVYLAFCVAPDGQTSEVTKILFIN